MISLPFPYRPVESYELSKPMDQMTQDDWIERLEQDDKSADLETLNVLRDQVQVVPDLSAILFRTSSVHSYSFESLYVFWSNGKITRTEWSSLSNKVSESDFATDIGISDLEAFCEKINEFNAIVKHNMLYRRPMMLYFCSEKCCFSYQSFFSQEETEVFQSVGLENVRVFLETP